LGPDFDNFVGGSQYIRDLSEISRGRVEGGGNCEWTDRNIMTLL